MPDWVGAVWRRLRWFLGIVGAATTAIGLVDVPDQLTKWAKIWQDYSLDQQAIRTLLVIVGLVLIAAAFLIRVPKRDVVTPTLNQRPSELPRVDVEITLADPPDDTDVGVLEWPHISIRNVSGRRLTQVHAEVLMTSRSGSSGTIENLRWDPGDAEYVALEPDFPNNVRTLSLALRSREQDYAFNTAIRHIRVLLVQWECYLTGERFLLNGDVGLRIPPGGDTDLRVRVMFDQEGEAHAWFRAYVPRIQGKPLWIVPLSARRDDQ